MKALPLRRRPGKPGAGRRPAALSCLAATVLALATAAPRAGAAPAPPCGSSFDPFRYPRAAAQACGYQTFARAAVRALPGGGSSYDYLVHGFLVSFLVPPPGFDPATATGAQLAGYGFPARPTAAAALARWQAEMSHWRGAAAPAPFLAESHAHATASGNWAGYVVTGGSGAYTRAEAWYTEPTFYSSSCATNSESTWAGLGGWNSTALGQDGTAHGVPGIGNHQAWWEVFPDVGMMPVPGFYGHIGYLFDADTNRVSGGYSFYMYDYESGTSVSIRSAINDYSGDSAEVIAERPTVNGSLANLSNFRTMTVSASQANGGAISSYSAAKRLDVQMSSASTGDDLADPGPIGTGGHFTVSQHHCR